MKENQNQNQNRGGIPIDHNFWRNIGLISGDEHLLYVFKKTERIVTALYLVTNLIKDNDPLKWEIRERCMSLISSTVALASWDSQEKNSYLRFLLASLLETRTFISISLGSHIISQMNAEIISAEIDALAVHIKDRALEDATKAGYVLSKSFFTTESGGTVSKTDDKGQKEKVTGGKIYSESRTSMSFKDGSKIDDIQKNNRRNLILSALRNQPNLTIKDIAQSVPDCSIKTVQRELVDMVKVGLVKKEGDRRWSKYSIA
jgi:predicted transcriptional regulator